MPTIAPPFKATAKQNELARHWKDGGCSRLLASGAIRSGKTQAASRLLVETALESPALYLVARATYRELKDSTQRAMLHGDGSLPPLIPPETIASYRASDEMVTLLNGAQIIFRSLEEHGPEKIRNLSLAGVLVDQIEELRYEEGERLYDELLGRLSDPRGPRKLLAVANPAGTGHWLYRRFVENPDPGARWVHFTMRDNAQNLPDGYVEQMEAQKTSRPAWWRTFVLGEWGAIENAAFHVTKDSQVETFRLEDSHERFEAADYGLNGAPWCLWATDYDGNLIAVDLLYVKDTLASKLAEQVLERRRTWWGTSNHCYADPSLWRRAAGVENRWGEPASLDVEFREHGVDLLKANNDPRAGLMRIRELLEPDSQHPFPDWHPRRGELGAPRVFFTDACAKLVSELREAPLQPLEKRDGGEIVDPEWESRQGHAVAMCRYAVMTRPEASVLPITHPDIEHPDVLRAHEWAKQDLNDRELDDLLDD
jgi:PBSX family phage terminase large subunit